MKHLAALLLLVVVATTASAISIVSASPRGAGQSSGRRAAAYFEEPRSFRRAPNSMDRMPLAFVRTVGGEVIASRRVAAYTDREHRRWLLWAAKTADHQTCLAWGALPATRAACSPSRRLFRGRVLVYSIADGMIAGLTTQRVVRVDVEAADGAVKRIHPTSDGAFILECPRKGRRCGLSAIVARDRHGHALGRFTHVP